METAVRCASLLLVVASLACTKKDPPDPSPMRPPGAGKGTEMVILETSAQALQDLSPVRGFDHYLNGFHVLKHDSDLQMEAHQYCRNVNEEFAQCVIFDGNTEKANLVGVEYVISEKLFETLDDAEKQYWHPRNYEILSGQLVMPNVPALAEKAALAKNLNGYAKTWYLWNTGHHGEVTPSKLPRGPAMLAWSFQRDGQALASMVAERDRRLGVDTREKRQERSELVDLARRQDGGSAFDPR